MVYIEAQPNQGSVFLLSRAWECSFCHGFWSGMHIHPISENFSLMLEHALKNRFTLLIGCERTSYELRKTLTSEVSYWNIKRQTIVCFFQFYFMYIIYIFVSNWHVPDEISFSDHRYVKLDCARSRKEFLKEQIGNYIYLGVKCFVSGGIEKEILIPHCEADSWVCKSRIT